MKFAALFAALFLLSACNRTPEERQLDEAAFQGQMPEGCTFHDLGSYQRTNHRSIPVIAVTCDDRLINTTTTLEVIQSGKTSHEEVAVTIAE